MAAPMVTDNIKTRHITPGHSPISLDFKEYWNGRELLYFLAWRDIKVRYKQTAIGVIWLFLQPLLTTIILTVIFGSVARFDTGVLPYPIFVLSGIIPWLFVYNAITMSSNSFVSNANLVTKVYFPRMIVPLSSVTACAFDLLVSFPIVILVALYYRTAISWQIVLLPLFLILLLLQTAAFGILFSAIKIRFRDVKFTLPFILQVWMLASPIFYPSSLLPERWRYWYAINPLTGVIEGIRSSLFGADIDWQLVGVSSISIAVLVVGALFVFRRMEDAFADMI